MSHLPHVFAYKQKMNELGISCAVTLAEHVKEPFIAAILRYHAHHSDRLGMEEHLEQKIWQRLDSWNNISPIDAPGVMGAVKYRLNTIRKTLCEEGRLPPVFKAVIVTHGDQGVDITANDTYRTLVDFLVNELEHGHD